MSCSLVSRGAILNELTDADHAALEQVVSTARSEERTLWVARVVAVEPVDLVGCYAATGRQDRFFWAQGETDQFAIAWGIGDEIESAGSDRFADVRSWQHDVRARITWIGEGRPETAPTFFGGFGFESEARGSEDWKSFPAARFILPEVILEGVGTKTRFVAIVRVEPGANVDSVASELLCRTASMMNDAQDEPPTVKEQDEVPVLGSLALPIAEWDSGPQFNVRADRPHRVFKEQIETALDAFAEGDLSKVVLARSLSIEHDSVLDVPAFLGRLRELYPTCTLVAMGRGDDTFLAATPELLVRVEGRVVTSAALAGSAPRGRHPEEDRAFGEALLASVKERSEHAYVVDALRIALADRCASLEVPAAPRLRALFGIQHLETPIRGELAIGGESDGDEDVLGLVEALHPTPAVGGVPRSAAQSWLRQHEGLDRGWYAAPIGWLDLGGGGDFRVALRSGLIRNGLAAKGEGGASRARLFAGAGLVEGSDPEAELVETRIKLRALLAPLTEI